MTAVKHLVSVVVEEQPSKLKVGGCVGAWLKNVAVEVLLHRNKQLLICVVTIFGFFRFPGLFSLSTAGCPFVAEFNTFEMAFFCSSPIHL